MVRIHWENMPPYQIVLALLQDSVLPLGRFVCWSLLAASWTFLRNLAHLLKFAKSSLNHDFHTLQANVHTKMIIMTLHGKMKQTFSKLDAESAKTFFSHVQSSGVRSIKILSHLLSTVDVLKWGYFLGMSPDLFITKKAQTTFSCSLLLCCSFRIFFHVDLSQKSLLFDWSRNEHDIHRGSCHKRRPPFFVAPHQNASFKKNQFFVKSPCACFIQTV